METHITHQTKRLIVKALTSGFWITATAWSTVRLTHSPTLAMLCLFRIFLRLFIETLTTTTSPPCPPGCSTDLPPCRPCKWHLVVFDLTIDPQHTTLTLTSSPPGLRQAVSLLHFSIILFAGACPQNPMISSSDTHFYVG